MVCLSDRSFLLLFFKKEGFGLALLVSASLWIVAMPDCASLIRPTKGSGRGFGVGFLRVGGGAVMMVG